VSSTKTGMVIVHRNLATTREAFEQVIGPFREEVVVCVECIVSWYWIVDLCSELGVAFVLVHALYMKAIHGGKTKNDKIGNAHLKWAFSEAAVLFLKDHQAAKDWHDKLVGQYGKATALSIMAQKLGRTVYFMLKRKEPFDSKRFFAQEL
jgi:hypothetical protein